MKNTVLLLGFLFQIGISSHALAQANKRILMFCSYDDTYYSEYHVMKQSLEASGYIVDVRTTVAGDIGTYMVPANTDIESAANSLNGSSYSDFTTSFQNYFGISWDASSNATPAFVPSMGTIAEVSDISTYDAFVIAGGTGIIRYLIQSAYTSAGSGNRFIHAALVESTAVHLNELGLAFLEAGKPVLAQCHGATIPIYWRIPGTLGSGAESLGFSILKDQAATGYPDLSTEARFNGLHVNYLGDSAPVCIASCNSLFSGAAEANSRVITSRDWYPQTVAYAARTLLNVLETYPSKANRELPVSVLVLHGGAVDPSNCSPANRANDVPCNYGSGTDDLPADYTHLLALLNGSTSTDGFNFQVTELNLTNSNLPFDPNNEAEILAYLKNYHTLLFYKHWSTGVTHSLNEAIIQYADDGGGVVALHHGLYNDIDGLLNKNGLTQGLFSAESAMNTWSANLGTYTMLNTNYGHFVSSFGYASPSFVSSLGHWGNNPLPVSATQSYSSLPAFQLNDERYLNMRYFPGTIFGRGENEITPLFSNTETPDEQAHTSGFTKLFNSDGNASVGRLVYLQAGERKENLISGPLSGEGIVYGQIVRNALVWSANLSDNISEILELNSSNIKLFPNPLISQNDIHVNSGDPIRMIKVFALNGTLLNEVECSNMKHVVWTPQLPAGSYLLQIESDRTTETYPLIIH